MLNGALPRDEVQQQLLYFITW